jgi:hypothetical protein
MERLLLASQEKADDALVAELEVHGGLDKKTAKPQLSAIQRAVLIQRDISNFGTLKFDEFQYSRLATQLENAVNQVPKTNPRSRAVVQNTLDEVRARYQLYKMSQTPEWRNIVGADPEALSPEIQEFFTNKIKANNTNIDVKDSQKLTGYIKESYDAFIEDRHTNRFPQVEETLAAIKLRPDYLELFGNQESEDSVSFDAVTLEKIKRMNKLPVSTDIADLDSLIQDALSSL